MTEIFGIPAHPLMVHLPVVLIPLCLAGTVLMLVRPSWRGALLVPVAVLAAIGALGAILASNSGEWLIERVKESPQLHDHEELGEMARNFAIVFAAALFIWALRELTVGRGMFATTPLPRWLSPKWVGTAAVVGSFLFGSLATVWTVRAGHTGAKAAWKGKVGPPTERVGDRYPGESD